MKEMEETLDQKDRLLKLEQKFDDDGKEGDVARLTAIEETSEHDIANDQLVTYINLLHNAIHHKIKPYPPLIKSLKQCVSDSFHVAVAKHFQEKSKHFRKSIHKALGISVVGKGEPVLSRKTVDKLKEIEEKIS